MLGACIDTFPLVLIQKNHGGNSYENNKNDGDKENVREFCDAELHAFFRYLQRRRP